MSRGFAVSALAFFLTGCAVGEMARRPDLPAPREVVSRLLSRKNPSAFRSIVFVEIDIPEEGSASPLQEVFSEGGTTFAGKAVLLWKAPYFLRMEFLSPFGSPVFIVAVSKEQIRAYSVPQDRYYVGRADSESMARWLGLPVSPSLMLRVLQGGIPSLNDEARSAASLAWDDETGGLRLEVPPGAGLERRQVAILDSARLEPRQILIGEEGAAIQVRYGPFRKVGAALRPEWAEMKDLRSGRKVRVVMEEEGEGGDISAEIFRLNIPPGARVVPLFRGGGG